MKTIVISGASGFIGKELCQYFTIAGFTVIKIERDDLRDTNKLQIKIDKADIIFNLAGANIIKRWTESYKEEMYSSRIDTTKKIVNAINSSKKEIELLVSMSAIGIYDNKKSYNEENAVYRNDYLSNLCQDWEKETNKAKCRVISFRSGIVLGNQGGAFKKMKKAFSFGFGARISTGQQALSFIHIDDLKSAFYFAIEKESMHHAYNLCASIPTTNNNLTKVLSKKLKKPVLFTIPKFVLELMFSEGASVLTDGQSIYPKRLEDIGFKFEFNCIEDAVDNLCK